MWRDATVGVFQHGAVPPKVASPTTRTSAASTSAASSCAFDQLLGAAAWPAGNKSLRLMFIWAPPRWRPVCPAFAAEPFALAFATRRKSRLVSLWLGNQITGACAPRLAVEPGLLCGRSSGAFTLYPARCGGRPLHRPPGPHAGRSAHQLGGCIAAPDLQRYPRFAQAQARAQGGGVGTGGRDLHPQPLVASGRGPGWALNGLINYWWRRSPAWSDSPMHGAVADPGHGARFAAGRAAKLGGRSVQSLCVLRPTPSTAAHVPATSARLARALG